MDAKTLFSHSRAETELLCRRAAEAQTQMLPSPPGGEPDALARVVLGAELVVDPRDETIARHLCALGIWEWWVSKALLRALPPDAVAIDIGANAGYFAALMLQAGARHVMAVEPQPELVRRLRASRIMNGWEDRLTVVGAAVGSQRGELEVVYSGPNNLGGVHVRPVGGAGAGSPMAVVPVAPLDEQVRENLGSEARVDLIKIDAEGSEPDIWLGMRETLANNPDCHVFAEVLGVEHCIAWLAELWDTGWVPQRVLYDGGETPVRPEQVTPEDVLMIHLHRGIRS